MFKILIVEDEKNIAEMISVILKMNNYESVICNNGESAIEMILNNDFDLILLDIMLPKFNGYEVIERVKKKDVPIIFLSAKQEIEDKIRGLKLGADDYIVKPFESIELLTRIEVVLRRYKKPNKILQFKDIIIDVERHELKKNNVVIYLPPKEFQVLEYFLNNTNKLLTREKLLNDIWGYKFFGETRTVDIHVQHIRKELRLEDCLITIPRLGYRLEEDNNL